MTSVAAAFSGDFVVVDDPIPGSWAVPILRVLGGRWGGAGVAETGSGTALVFGLASGSAEAGA